MTMPRKAPFRAGGAEAPRSKTRFTQAQAGPAVLLADISEFQPDVADAVYLAWSPAVVIRAAYGAAHDDGAWYGGQRRQRLHDGGARFLGIYQYLVSGQDGAAQADAMHRLVGALRPGEVLTPDFEEGQHAMLTAWYNRMLTLYGAWIRPYLWTYSGLFFAAAQGAAPVDWVAAYGQAEPTVPHKLWQFTSSFPVPGVGNADCSVFHGRIDQLAALAFQGSTPAPPPPPPAGPGPAFSQPRHVTVNAGDTTVEVVTCEAPAHGGPPDHYLVDVFTGSFPSDATRADDSYPRYMAAAPKTFGSLQGIASGAHMTCRVTAVDRAGNSSAYTDVGFQMP
jgi:hypothetical protein